MPVLGKRERDATDASADGDTAIVTPADEESAHEFFAPFLDSDKSASSYSDLISIASNLFEPGKFVARAVTAAADFIASNGGIDEDALDRAVADVRARGLTQVICDAQLRLREAGTVLTPEAAETVFAGDPELERIRALAEGCPIDTHPDFVPNWGDGVAPRIGQDGDATLPLLVHAIKDAKKGKCVILPLSVAVDAAKSEGLILHVSERFLRDKETDPLGRPIPDFSHSKAGTPPNHPDLRATIAERWGTIEHPDITDISRALLAARSVTPRGRVWGSRVDINAAYTRILIRPSDVTLLATLLVTDHPRWGTLVALPLVNQWGHQCAGHAFEVISRALTRRASARTNTPDGRPTGDTYVDDRMQFGSRELVVREAADLATDARAALGHDAVNDAKTVISTRFDTIGWRCNTIAFTIAPSPRAVLKLLYVFNVATPQAIAIGHPIKARHLLRLSSLATRYSRAIVPLRPFSASFGRNAGGTNINKAAVRHLTGAALTDITAWRAVLRTATHNPRVLEVPARWLSVADAPPDVQIANADVQVWADSQGNGGIGVYVPGVLWDFHLIEETTYFSHGKRTPLNNNLFEFVAALAAFIAVASLPHPKKGTRDGLHVHAHTDNTSALAWLRKQRAESGFHTFLLRLLCDAQVRLRSHVTASHIPGALNRHADAISRQFRVPDGNALRLEVTSATPRRRVIGPLWAGCKLALARRSPTASETDQDVLTALESVIGTLSAGST